MVGEGLFCFGLEGLFFLLLLFCLGGVGRILSIFSVLAPTGI